MRLLIVKLGATGDVVRTTPILTRFSGEVTWITAAKNVVFVQGIRNGLRGLSWEQREQARDQRYDLVVNLEDDLESAQFLKTIEHSQLFGAYADDVNRLRY